MNKILVNNSKSIESNILVENDEILIKEDVDIEFELEDYHKDINIHILENVTAHIKFFGNNLQSNVKVLLEKDSYLHIDSLLVDSDGELSIFLLGQNAEIKCINSVITNRDSKLKFIVSHDYESTKSLFVNNGLVLHNNKLIFDVNGIVQKNSKGSICIQDSKIITRYSQLASILPNLYIDNYDIEAEHSAYIGMFKEEDMFYLMSRGISRNDAYLLLVKSFLLGRMELTDLEKEKFINKINHYIGKGDK